MYYMKKNLKLTLTFTGLLAMIFLLLPTMAQAEVGHLRISQNYQFVDRLEDAVYGSAYDTLIPLEVDIDDEGTREAVTADDPRRGTDYIFKMGNNGTLPTGFSLTTDGHITTNGVAVTANGSRTFYVRVEDPDGTLLAGRYLTLYMVSKQVSVSVSNLGPHKYVDGGKYRICQIIKKCQ